MHGNQQPFPSNALNKHSPYNAVHAATRQGVVPNSSTAAALAALPALRRLHLDLLHDGYDKAMQVRTPYGSTA